MHTDLADLGVSMVEEFNELREVLVCARELLDLKDSLLQVR